MKILHRTPLNEVDQSAVEKIAPPGRFQPKIHILYMRLMRSNQRQIRKKRRRSLVLKEFNLYVETYNK